MNEDSFRIDKHFASGIGQLTRRLDADDDTLIRNIIYHVAESYEHSLFGYGTIDQTDFARRWNYQTSNLRKRHPSTPNGTLPAAARTLPGGRARTHGYGTRASRMRCTSSRTSR